MYSTGTRRLGERCRSWDCRPRRPLIMRQVTTSDDLWHCPSFPHETIEATFESLRPDANTQPLKEFVHYIGETWINSRVWPPKCWSVFMLSVRTKNDIESWHRALNRRAAGPCGVSFYLLLSLLHNEARLVSLQIRLLSERKLKRIQRAAYRQLQSRLFELWEAFNKREKSLKQLLKGCANINRPVIV